MDPLQAAILRNKLKKLKAWNKKRSAIAKFYVDELKSTDLILPFVPQWADPAWHLFCIRHKKRDILKKLLEKKIETLIHYPIPPHKQKAFKFLKFNKRKFPITEKHSFELLSLPIGPHLSNQQCEYVCENLIRILKNIIDSKMSSPIFIASKNELDQIAHVHKIPMEKIILLLFYH